MSWLRFAPPAGILINVIMLGVHSWRGGWWLAFVPLNMLAASYCVWAWWRITRQPA